jgi:hypothetical protein
MAKRKKKRKKKAVTVHNTSNKNLSLKETDKKKTQDLLPYSLQDV